MDGYVYFGKKEIDAMKHCKIISFQSTGYNEVDLDYATEKGIGVCSILDYCTQETAENTMALMLNLLRGIRHYDRSVQQDKVWDYLVAKDLHLKRIAGQVLGIAGLGRIGQSVARKALGFDMSVIAYDPYLSRETIEAEGCACAESLEALCREADVISLHVPLTEENRHLINARSLSWMKPSALLLNFSRGLVVDNDALYEALSEGRLAGAALDAHVPEPPDFAHPLYRLDNVLLSPHIAGNSEDALRRMSLKLAEGIDDVLSGRVPDSCANKKELYGG